MPKKGFVRAWKMREKGRLGRQGSSSASLKPIMAYLVNVVPRAERDLANLYEQIDAGNSGTALKWYRGLKRAVLSLEEQPERCPVTREDSKLRNLLYGRKPH